MILPSFGVQVGKVLAHAAQLLRRSLKSITSALGSQLSHACYRNSTYPQKGCRLSIGLRV